MKIKLKTEIRRGRSDPIIKRKSDYLREICRRLNIKQLTDMAKWELEQQFDIQWQNLEYEFCNKSYVIIDINKSSINRQNILIWNQTFTPVRKLYLIH